MTKRKVTKLLAVVALTASAPLIASADHATLRAPAGHRGEPDLRPAPAPPVGSSLDPWATDPWATAARSSPQPAQRVARPLVESMFAVFGISVPRQLQTGAPACGNVAGRAPRPVDCKP
ncbi:MAG: hypothetical protein H6Q90_3684 [Deltaproteobacteria bacterium]|nr:hypothetical protein [Deltaproteobacteria bacterium]